MTRPSSSYGESNNAAGQARGIPDTAMAPATPAPAAPSEKDEKDEAYYQRNVLVAALTRLYPSGIRKTNIEGWSDDWHGCVYIDLPTGQVSYHYHDSHAHLFAALPPYEKPWDGHNKDTVHSRLLSLPSATGESVPNAIRHDAMRWRALFECSRIRVLGYARGGPKGRDGPIRHIGFEWTTDQEPYCDTELLDGKERLVEFTDAILNASADNTKAQEGK